jgi:hypothetical protein
VITYAAVPFWKCLGSLKTSTESLSLRRSLLCSINASLVSIMAPRNKTFESRPEPFSDRADLQLKDSQVSGPIAFFNPTRARFDQLHPATDDTKPATSTGAHFQWRSRDNRKGRHTIVVPADAKSPQYPQPTCRPHPVLKGILRMFTTFPWWDVSFLVAFFFSIGCAIFIACGLFYWLSIAYPATEFPHEAGTAGK